MCVDSLNEIKALTRVKSESEKKCVNAAVKTDNKKSHARIYTVQYRRSKGQKYSQFFGRSEQS